MQNQKILIVDDEADLREILQFNLENAGYGTDCVCSAEEALEKLTPEHDLMLLDVMMEGMSGFELAKLLRERGDRTPIIFLTALNAEKNMLSGFSSGADDYICKPFSIHEVLARVQAVLRRSSAPVAPAPQQPKDEIVSGKVRIDLTKKMIYISGAPVTLSKKEYEIFLYLASREGELIPRETIKDELWKDAPYVLDRTVDVHIARIRAKLGECKNYLTNRSGYGYSFVHQDD